MACLGPRLPCHTVSYPELLKKWAYPRLPAFCYQMSRAGLGSPSSHPAPCPGVSLNLPALSSVPSLPQQPVPGSSPSRQPMEASSVRQPCLWRSPVSSMWCLFSSSPDRQAPFPRWQNLWLPCHAPYEAPQQLQGVPGPSPGPTATQKAMDFGPVSGILHLPTACFTETLHHYLGPTSHTYFRGSTHPTDVGAAKLLGNKGGECY